MNMERTLGGDLVFDFEMHFIGDMWIEESEAKELGIFKEKPIGHVLEVGETDAKGNTIIKVGIDPGTGDYNNFYDSMGPLHFNCRSRVEPIIVDDVEESEARTYIPPRAHLKIDTSAALAAIFEMLGKRYQ